MSDKKDENRIGFWLLVAAISIVALYFGHEILNFILESIQSIVGIIQQLIKEVLYFALFVGAIYVIVKIAGFIKK